MSINDIHQAVAALRGESALSDRILALRLGECRIDLRSNSPELLDELAEYFAHVVVEPNGAPDMELLAVEREVADLGVDYTDWAREPGKAGRKDAYYDFPGARLVLKVRTGMQFLQSADWRIAAGPCRRYPNQVINFLNAQYMNWLQNRDYLICHAAGLVYRERAFGIAGFSGGGKSTLMLRLLDHDDVDYLTYDRLFIRCTTGAPKAMGIAKLPRVNPGTIVHNPRLQSLISPEKRAELLALPPEELWQLEDKYDVDVAQVYGPDRIVQNAPLGAFIILNWNRDSDAPPQVRQVNLAQNRKLLGAIMKSPGPFYQYTDGSFFQDTTPLDEEAYLDGLLGVDAYEVSGGVDFDAVTDMVLQQVLA
jgi:HprK-related kinase B